MFYDTTTENISILQNMILNIGVRLSSLNNRLTYLENIIKTINSIYGLLILPNGSVVGYGNTYFTVFGDPTYTTELENNILSMSASKNVNAILLESTPNNVIQVITSNNTLNIDLDDNNVNNIMNTDEYIFASSDKACYIYSVKDKKRIFSSVNIEVKHTAIVNLNDEIIYYLIQTPEKIFIYPIYANRVVFENLVSITIKSTITNNVAFYILLDGKYYFIIVPYDDNPNTNNAIHSYRIEMENTDTKTISELTPTTPTEQNTIARNISILILEQITGFTGYNINDIVPISNSTNYMNTFYMATLSNATDETKLNLYNYKGNVGDSDTSTTLSDDGWNKVVMKQTPNESDKLNIYINNGKNIITKIVDF